MQALPVLEWWFKAFLHQSQVFHWNTATNQIYASDVRFWNPEICSNKECKTYRRSIDITTVTLQELFSVHACELNWKRIVWGLEGKPNGLFTKWMLSLKWDFHKYSHKYWIDFCSAGFWRGKYLIATCHLLYHFVWYNWDLFPCFWAVFLKGVSV